VSPQPITRRATVTGFAAVVAGGAAGFAYARTTSAAKDKSANTGANSYGTPTQPSTGGAAAKPLAQVSQIPAGGGVILSGPKVVLTKGSDGTVHAFSAVCTHQACTVNKVSGGVISCPCHGSKYDVNTGAVVGGPAPAPLPKVAVVVRGNDVLRA
jgi:Rieske Fe-S protein